MALAIFPGFLHKWGSNSASLCRPPHYGHAYSHCVISGNITVLQPWWCSESSWQYHPPRTREQETETTHGTQTSWNKIYTACNT